MRHIIRTVFFVLLATSVSAQEFSDPLMRKLNDFLPTYTPFAPLEPPDRYFPDEVGKKVASAIVAAYQQDPQAVEQHARELAQHDVALQEKGELPTGLTTYLVTLVSQSHTENEEHDPALAAVSASPDALLERADELLTEEKRGRIGRRFNWILSTFDVARLFLGAPSSPSPYGAQGIVSTWNDNDPGPRERKALVFYHEFLRRFPDDSRVAEVRAKAEDLESRRKQAMLAAEIAQAEGAYKKDDYWGANFHYQLALMIDEGSEEAQQGIAQVEARLQQHQTLDTAKPQDPLAAVHQAEWERDKQTLQYLLPGGGFVKDNIVVAGTQIATEGLAGAATFGALTVIQTVAKLFRLVTSNPIPQQQVITEGERYVRNTPEGEQDPEVYLTLAKAYEREGRFEKAINYYEQAGQEGQVDRLREQAAAGLLQMAKSEQHQSQKEKHLRMLIERYPKTKAAREAAPLFRELNLPANRGLQLTKAFLREHGELVGPRGLGLKATLLDGDIDNVELTDDGITLLPTGEIALRLQSDHGPRTKVYAVPEQRWEQFWRRLREKGYEQATNQGDLGLARLAQGAEDADLTMKGAREKNDASGWKILPYLSGSVGESGVDLRGTLPKEIAGTRLSFGNDQHSTYVGVEVPMPFIPVDFLLLGRNGTPSLYPRIRIPEQGLHDENLYR